MYRHCIGLIFALLALLPLGACTDKTNAGDAISRAETALDDAQFDRAQDICDSLVNGDGCASLSTSDLCRTSLVYIKLAEVREQEFNTASAMTCLGAAMSKDSAAVDDFIAQQPADDQSMLIMVRTLVGRTQLSDFKDEPVDNFDQYSDSI